MDLSGCVEGGIWDCSKRGLDIMLNAKTLHILYLNYYIPNQIPIEKGTNGFLSNKVTLYRDI